MTTNRNTIIIGIIVIIIIILGVWYFIGNSASTSQNTATTTAATSTATGSTGTTGTAANTTTKTTTTVTTTAAPAQGTVAVPPQIIEFDPAAGSAGTQVTIKGTNFSRTANYVTFGTSGNRHTSNGTPDNQIAVVTSADGTSITFTVPSSGPSGMLCDAQDQCVAISAVALTPGNYPVTVRTAGGTSNTKDFVLTK